jgi:hypothetical protein
MHVAVVMTKDGKSLRSDGQFAAFVGKTRDEAAKLALDHSTKWALKKPDRGYHVLIGALSARCVAHHIVEYQPLEEFDDNLTDYDEDWDEELTPEKVREQVFQGVKTLFAELSAVMRDELGIELEDLKITKMR